jgi:hypothetical protein
MDSSFLGGLVESNYRVSGSFCGSFEIIGCD